MASSKWARRAWARCCAGVLTLAAATWIAGCGDSDPAPHPEPNKTGTTASVPVQAPEPEETDATHTNAMRTEMTRARAAALAAALDMFRLSSRRLPSSLDELAEGRSGEPFIDKVPNDGWERPFTYAVRSRSKYELRSAGADGELDTADDIVWPPPAPDGD